MFNSFGRLEYNHKIKSKREREKKIKFNISMCYICIYIFTKEYILKGSDMERSKLFDLLHRFTSNGVVSFSSTTLEPILKKYDN